MPRSSRTSQAAMAAAADLSMWSGRTGNATDPSASSASVTSPLASSHAASEAESYQTRGITGIEEEDAGDATQDEQETGDEDEGGRHGDSHLLQDSDEEDNQDIDSLADASPEEVEARVMQTLGWDDIGKDKDLPEVDLVRWKTISPEHLKEGRDENNYVKSIQADLLKAVQELDTTDWMYPEPAPFAARAPNTASMSEARTARDLPYSGFEPSWTDAAFNPLSTLPPAFPTHSSSSYPDAGRVQRAIASGRHPDLSYLDVQARELLGNPDRSFAAHANFPWAASLGTSINANGTARGSGGSSLTREVEIITL